MTENNPEKIEGIDPEIRGDSPTTEVENTVEVSQSETNETQELLSEEQVVDASKTEEVSEVEEVPVEEAPSTESPVVATTSDVNVEVVEPTSNDMQNEDKDGEKLLQPTQDEKEPADEEEDEEDVQSIPKEIQRLKEPSIIPAILLFIFSALSFIVFVLGLILFILIVVRVGGWDPLIDDQTPRGDERVKNPAIDFYVPIDAIVCCMAFGFLAISYMALLAGRVLLQPVGIKEPNGKKLYHISLQIAKGATAFLLSEGLVVSIFVVIVFCVLLIIYGLLYAFDNTAERGIVVPTPLSFIIGAFSSGVTMIIGMGIATRSNVRTAHAARVGGLEKALHVAFDGGTVMSMSVQGFSLVMVCASYLIFRDVKALAGFGFGASGIALFARVGGGIFTKAADVGADLVGKVEAGIPEDDPRNPAVIADNVGDNVGDVAGMGSDLFETFAGTIIATATLGADFFQRKGVALPFYLSASSVICSIMGSLFVSTGVMRFIPFPKVSPDSKRLQSRLLFAIRKGIVVAAILNIAVAAGIIFPIFHDAIHPTAWCLFLCYIIGMACGVLIGFSTEAFTADIYPPVKQIARAGMTGPATVIIKGLSIGMMSTAPQVILVGAAILGCMYLGDYASSRNAIEFRNAGVYGISIAAIGMLGTLGVTLATDAYGPIADNAGGLAEMAGLPSEVREKTDALDSLGNTTAATGKGFSIGSAVLTALALLSAFSRTSGITTIDILDQKVTFGILIGGLMPFVFAALTMNSVNTCAMDVIKEVRRQFREIEGIMEFKAQPDHARCVRMCTFAALREMIIPGSLAVICPLIIGFAGRQEMLAGFLSGSITTGFLLAVTMSNAGGAWDNAKKLVEAKGVYDKENDITYKKNSETHKAAVVGDTVGDPFKDVSGPSMNVLIKLMATVALVIAPVLARIYN